MVGAVIKGRTAAAIGRRGHPPRLAHPGFAAPARKPTLHLPIHGPAIEGKPCGKSSVPDISPRRLNQPPARRPRHLGPTRNLKEKGRQQQMHAPARGHASPKPPRLLAIYPSTDSA